MQEAPLDKKQLEILIEKDFSTHGIARELGCSQCKVRFWLRKYGLNTKNLPSRKSCLKNGRQCTFCDKELEGAQAKFCSKKCKAQFWYHNGKKDLNPNTNERQKRVSKERKLTLIELKGGCCQICGYSKNSAALCFHHRNPQEKTFNIDGRKLSNTKWDSLLEESKKCDLLCSNCHLELHNKDKYL